LPRLRIRGTVPPLPRTFSWRGAYVRTGANLHFAIAHVLICILSEMMWTEL